MARFTDDLRGGGAPADTDKTTISAEGEDRIALPDPALIRQGDLSRDGQDLVIEGPDGSIIVIEGYFIASPPPVLEAAGGLQLTPALVESFVQQAGPVQVAAADTQNDASPVGTVKEVSGTVTVTHVDGTTEPLTAGAPIYEGDIITTAAQGAVNIMFTDESTFAVSENARLAIDEYVFDPGSQSGESNFSLLRGLFVFTSGLIGRDDPDDVSIDTPMGSIGIRGTIIAGNIDTGVITVVEGAIVLRSNSGQETTLASQFETARFTPGGDGIELLGTHTPSDLSGSFSSLSGVAPDFFSGIGNAPPQDGTQAAPDQPAAEEENQPDPSLLNDPRFDFRGENNMFRDGDGAFDGHNRPAGRGNRSGGGRPGGKDDDSTGDGSGKNDKDKGKDQRNDQEDTDPRAIDPDPPLKELKLRIDREDINENATPGTLVATVTLTRDFDPLTFSLDDDMGGKLVLQISASGKEAEIRIAPGQTLSGEDKARFEISALAEGRTVSRTYDVEIENNPLAQADDLDADETGTFTADVFADNGNGADSDLDGDSLTVTKVNGSIGNVGIAVGGSGGGLFTIDDDGALSFDPNGAFDELAKGETDTTTVTYTMTDGTSESTAIVTLTVTGADDTFLMKGNRTYNDSFGAAQTITITNTANTANTAGGADTIDIEGGSNTVDTGSGDDTVTVVTSAATGNTISTDIGNDTIIVGSNTTGSQESGNIINAGSGADHIHLLASAGDNNILRGDGGNDTFHLSLASQPTALTMDGGTGTDTLSFNDAGTFTFMSVLTDLLHSIEIIDAKASAAAQDLTINVNQDLVDSWNGAFQVILGSGDILEIDVDALGFYEESVTGGIGTYKNAAGDTIIIDVSAGGSYTIIGLIAPPGGSPAINLNALVPMDGFKLTDDIGEGFGYGAAALGDIDADGYDDVAFTKLLNTGTEDGRAFILPGDDDNLSQDVAGFSSIGRIDSDLLGGGGDDNTMRISGAGDFDGDGVKDYVVSIPTDGSATGIVQIVSGAGPAGTPDILLTIRHDSNALVGFSIAGVGDLNRDGFADILVGAPGVDHDGGPYTADGSAYLVFGGPRAQDSLNFFNPDDLGGPHLIETNADGADFSQVVATATNNGHIAYVLEDGKVSSYQIKNGSMQHEETLIDSALSGALSIAAKDDHAYIATGNNIVVIGPVAGSLDVKATIGFEAELTLVKGNILYAYGYDSTTLVYAIQAYDISDADSPSSIYLQPALEGQDIHINDGKIYILDQDVTFDITIAIHNADDGTNIGTETVAYNRNAVSFAVYGDFVYIASLEEILIYDMANNTSQTAAFTGLNITDIGIYGDTLYVSTADDNAGGSTGFVLSYDLSNSIVAETLGVQEGSVQNAALDDSYGLVFDGEGFIYAAAPDGLVSLNPNEQAAPYHGTGGNEQGLGAGVSGTGDFNADGYNDFMILSGEEGVVRIQSGEAVITGEDLQIGGNIIVGPPSGTDITVPMSHLGDFNGDGISDIFAGFRGATDLDAINVYLGSAGANTAIDMNITADSDHVIIGAGSVGDFNGDGFDDIAIAYRGTTPSTEYNVDIYVLYGSITPATTVDNAYFADTNSAHITYTIADDNPPDEFTISLSAAGDVNGDGYHDLLIGLPNEDNNEDGSQDLDGAAAVVYGRKNPGDTDVIEGSGPINATANDQSLVAKTGAATFESGAFTNLVFRGGKDSDTIRVQDESSIRDMDGGGGYDTLEVIGTLDLLTLGSESIKRVEEIAMKGTTGSLSNSLTLALRDVFSMLESSDTGTLKIDYTDATGNLTLESGRATTLSNATAQDVAEALGSSAPVSDGAGFFEFHIGSYTLSIDAALFDQGNITLGTSS